MNNIKYPRTWISKNITRENSAYVSPRWGSNHVPPDCWSGVLLPISFSHLGSGGWYSQTTMNSMVRTRHFFSGRPNICRSCSGALRRELVNKTGTKELLYRLLYSCKVIFIPWKRIQHHPGNASKRTESNNLNVLSNLPLKIEIRV